MGGYAPHHSSPDLHTKQRLCATEQRPSTPRRPFLFETNLHTLFDSLLGRMPPHMGGYAPHHPGVDLHGQQRLCATEAEPEPSATELEASLQSCLSHRERILQARAAYAPSPSSPSPTFSPHPLSLPLAFRTLHPLPLLPASLAAVVPQPPRTNPAGARPCPPPCIPSPPLYSIPPPLYLPPQMLSQDPTNRSLLNLPSPPVFHHHQPPA
jgi:hypothetical protein